MFYVVCPLCSTGIEIAGTSAGPECSASQNAAVCSQCGEPFYFDAREVVEEPEPSRATA